MDFVNKAYVQISEMLSTMSPGARIIAGLLLVTVVVSLGFLVTQEVSGPDRYLFGARPITDGEIANATAAFAQAGLSEWQVEGNRIRVPRGNHHVYLAALAENDALPEDVFDHLTKASSSSNMWMSDKQRQETMKIANERQLSHIIREMSGIDKAVVKYKETIESRFPVKLRKVTAAVSIWPTRSSLLSNEHVDSIRQLVASAVGADPNDIRVVDMVARKDRSNSLDAESSDFHLYQKVKQNLENYFAGKARKALSFIPDATVVVNVKLDDTVKSRIIAKTYNPQKSAAFEQKSTNNTERRSTVDKSGEVGLRRQGGGANVSAAVNSSDQTETIREKIVEESRSQVGEEYIEQVKQGLVPTRVTASVTVPQSYYREVWQIRHPAEEGQPPRAPTDDELRRLQEIIDLDIKKAVAPVLPQIPADEGKYEPVQVVAFEVPVVAEPEGPSLAATAMSWMGDNWSTLGMMLMGVFSLVMLRSMVRSFPQSPSAANAPVAEPVNGGLNVVSADDEFDDEDESPERFLQRSESGPNIREELVDIVREDPDAAAKVISSWIGNAG